MIPFLRLEFEGSRWETQSIVPAIEEFRKFRGLGP